LTTLNAELKSRLATTPIWSSLSAHASRDNILIGSAKVLLEFLKLLLVDSSEMP
jgi:hypothetical protein